ncbi:MAG: glycyl-radical enzyme activating protein [Desulfobacteraceae bacterium]|nr:glycyl-radical enzyme activating protein [Desulfobacteraceae bacterium]
MVLPQKGDGKKGLIFNLQRFSIHDGPGIRTTVFMKGCPLKCLWCANPESQDFIPNLMVRDINCRGCGACVDACVEGAISMSKEGRRGITRDRCTQCLLCVDACIYGSLNVCGRYVGVEEVLEEVLKDSAFYKNSGGGMTVSGGEALSQTPFVTRLLKEAKREGLHTTIDTSGYVPWKEMKEVLRFADLVLFDIKHLDSEEHEKTTGVDNRQILDNLRRVSREKEVWLRVPLIAGFNDSDAHIDNIAVLGRDMGVEKISLLPYHEGGKSKSEQLGRSYGLPQAKAPGDDHIAYLKGFIEKRGIRASVGS